MLEHRGVPRQIHVDDGLRVLEIEPDPARVGGRNTRHSGSSRKQLYQRPRLSDGDAAVKQNVAQAARSQPSRSIISWVSRSHWLKTRLAS